jgi:hypothetical protein
MRFEYEGMSLWYGTPDAPAPSDAVVAGTPVSITIGVQPIDASNRVEVRFRLTGEAQETVVGARWLRNDLFKKAQYFVAGLPAFRSGDSVEYIVICGCVGGQIPPPQDARKSVAAFRVVALAPASVAQPTTVAAPKPTVRPATALGRQADALSDIARPSGYLAPNLPTASTESPGAVASVRAATEAPAGIRATQAPPVGEGASTPGVPKGRSSIGRASDRRALDQLVADQTSKAPTSKQTRMDQLRSVLRSSPELAALPSLDTFLELYANRYAHHRDPHFAASIAKEAGLGGDAINEVSAALELSSIVGPNIALISALQALRKEGRISAIRDFATFDTAQWKALLRGSGNIAAASNMAAGINAGQSVDDYVTRIDARLRQAYPTRFIAKSFESKPALDGSLIKRVLAATPDWNAARHLPTTELGKLNPSDQANAQALDALRREIKTFPDFDYRAALASITAERTGLFNPIRAGVAQFFTQAPDFEFRDVSVDRYIAKNPRAVAGIEPRAPVVAQLKRMQRVFHITQEPHAMSALMGEGFHSAFSIARVPAEIFVAEAATVLGGLDQARTAYATASSITAAIVSIAFLAKLRTSGPLPGGIGAWPPPVLATSDGGADLDTLFGSTDYCECEDCLSVLSPAAYFVDLLHNFLDSASALLFSVLVVLLSRRPDLQYIRLDCKNTDTPIPYLDLVNEILETCIVFKTTVPFKPGPPSAPAPNDTSADATADDLSVNPENTNPDAYMPLAQAVYPPSLPFNRWLETARSYLNALGTSRYELMYVFQAQGSPSQIDVACEYLGIAPEERAILSTADLNGQPLPQLHSVMDYYGDAGGNLPNFMFLMTMLSNFLHYSGLQFDEFLTLRKTRYVNPESLDPSKRLGVYMGEPCNLQALSQNYITNLDTPEQLGRIHRYFRLWRKLGWSMLDLDRCLNSFGASEVDDSLLVKLSQTKRLMERLGLPLVPLSAFWSDLDTYRYGDELDPYTALFQNKAVTNPVDACFQLSSPPAPRDIVGQPGCILKISAHLPAIQAALRLRTADLLALATNVVADDALTLRNLTVLYRHALLARTLRIAVADLILLKALYGADPFASPEATLDFLDFVDSVRSSGFTVAQIAYLYRDVAPATGGVAPAPETVAAYFADLRSGLAAIATDNALVADPGGDVARKKLMLLYNAPTVDQIIALLLGASVWNAPLATLPSLSVGDELKQKLLFSSAKGTLQFLGAMTTPERDALSAGQPADFQMAVQSLWQQPRAFIDTNLVRFPRPSTTGESLPFLDAVQAKNVLLDPTKSASDKFAFVLLPLLRYLTDSLSRNLVAQSLATRYNIDASPARLMLDHGLASRIDPSKPAMEDFLNATGLGARFFSDKTLLGRAVIRIDEQVDFSWGASSPDPSLNHGTFGARWVGLLTVPSSDDYRFVVRANDGVRLWIDKQLLIDDWEDQPVGDRAATISLKSGQAHTVRLEYYQATASAPEIHLSWSSSSAPTSIVPTNALSPLDHWTLFHKAAAFAGTFKLSADELGYLSSHGADFNGFDLSRLPLDPSGFDLNVFAAWRRIAAVVELRGRFVSPPIKVTDVFGAPSVGQAITALSSGTGWDLDQLTWLCGQSMFNLHDADFHDETKLLRVANCFDLAKRTEMSSAYLRRWATADMSGGDAPSIATEVTKAVKARYEVLSR